MWAVEPLHDDQFDDLKLGDSGTLFPIRPFFFVPPLDDKPQDPIFKALKVSELNRDLSTRALPQTKPLEEPAVPEEHDIPEVAFEGEEFWAGLLGQGRDFSSKTLSWDRLRDTFHQPRPATAFLSEQEPHILEVARHQVSHKLPDERVQIVHVSLPELHQALQLLVIGTSSTLFVWDSTSDTFVQSHLQPGKTGHVVIEGTDDVVSASVLARFLKIGTLLRRLEEFIKTLNQSMVKAGPTVHALAHSLSTTLSYLRTVLAKIASTDQDIPSAASWSKYAVYEEVLHALGELYGRSQDMAPESYPTFEPSPITIISNIYDHLSTHIERQSSHHIAAILAYILDSTSKEYLHHVGTSVGYGGQPRRQPLKTETKAEDYYYGMNDDEEEHEEDIFEALEHIQSEFPAFFPKELLDILPSAQKSLILLKKARPDHVLLNSEESKKKRIRWLWTEDDIVSTWNEMQEPHDGIVQDTLPPFGPVPSQSTISYPPEFAEFHVYDMEPGNLTYKSALQAIDRSTYLLSFIASFPTHLPPITPTLPHLTFLVFKKLLVHCETLSSTLLDLFISSSDTLNFSLHLELLRSYLLVTNPAFKTRLLEAIFSDAGEYEMDETARGMSLRALRRRPSKKKDKEHVGSKQPWAVGISENLLDREIWPPVSGDLSFFLRTVIVDSLNGGKDWDDEEARKSRHVIHEEAIWRIGFAIRDLPTGPGRDKWLNPLHIEALDFLYMDYKPPSPMDVLISDNILHKYQRIFAFILRLLRVESALKSVFRISRGKADPTFQNLPQQRRLFLHFRFISQSFIASLSSYVFDTAIGGNFDPFLARLSPKSDTTPEQEPLDQQQPRPLAFKDVFELANAHSNLLDDILSACLLRTGQKAVSELLRHSIELVLEFCIIVGEVHRKRMEEYRAAPLIEDLYPRFRAKMATLTKVLKGLVDKGPSSSRWPVELQVGERRPTGGSLALYHLLMRLDLGEWWPKGKPSDK